MLDEAVGGMPRRVEDLAMEIAIVGQLACARFRLLLPDGDGSIHLPQRLGIVSERELGALEMGLGGTGL